MTPRTARVADLPVVERRVVFPVAPVPKPRMTRRDQWRTDPNHPDPAKRQRPNVTRWFMFQNQMIGVANRERFRVPDAGLSLVFHIPMPPSWSRRKQAAMHGTPHQQTPDIDNYLKAFMDALTPNDATVWRLDSVEKRWSDTGRIVASVRGEHGK